MQIDLEHIPHNDITLSQAKYVVFDKTGTLTQGVFEVSAVHHNEMEEKKLLEYAALAECASSHPISKSLQKAYGKEIDRSRVSDIKEISGHGMPSLLMIKEIEKKTGAKYLEEIDRHTRLTEKQELKIKQMTTDIADMIEKDTAVPQRNDGIF